MTKPAVLEILSVTDDELGASQSEVKITITEGRYHQIKRMFNAVGMEVTYLKRLSMGPIFLDETLECGTYRRLTDEEIKLLREVHR